MSRRVQSHLEKAAAIAGGSSANPTKHSDYPLFAPGRHGVPAGSIRRELEYYRKALGLRRIGQPPTEVRRRLPRCATRINAWQRRKPIRETFTERGTASNGRSKSRRSRSGGRTPSYEDRYSIQGLRQSFGDLSLAAPDDPNLGDPAAALALHGANVMLSEQLPSRQMPMTGMRDGRWRLRIKTALDWYWWTRTLPRL